MGLEISDFTLAYEFDNIKTHVKADPQHKESFEKAKQLGINEDLIVLGIMVALYKAFNQME